MKAALPTALVLGAALITFGQTMHPFSHGGVVVTGNNVVASPADIDIDATPNMASLPDLLRKVDAILKQTLPALATYNDRFDFVDLEPTPTSGPVNEGANLSTNYSVLLGQSLGRDLSQNLASGPQGPGGMFPNGNFYQMPGATPTISSTAQPTLPFAVNRETLRLLLVLQADMERMASHLNQLKFYNNNADAMTFGSVQGSGLGQ